MAKIALQGNDVGTGTLTLQAPVTNLNRNLVLPDVDGTLSTMEQVKLPIGSFMWFTGTVAPESFIVADGELRSRAAFPDLWVFAQASGNISVDDASWTFGQYSPGDGATTFRVPKVDDRFIRGKSGTRPVGLVEEDEIKSHRHSTNLTQPTPISGGATWGSDVINPGNPNVINTSWFGGDETRPKALTMLPCIKAYDVISDPNVLNAVEVVNSVADVNARVTPCLSTDEYLHVRDEKASGINGGTSSNTTWHTRDLNAVKTNTISGASVASNRITLPAGTYYLKASAPCYSGARHKVRIRNFTDSSDIAVGFSAFAVNTSGQLAHTRSGVTTLFTLASSKVIELSHYIESGVSNNGLGVSTNASGYIEVYSEVEIWKIG